MHAADEVAFACRYFPEIHVDIEDGVVVQGISFGMKMWKGIRKIATVPASLHLEVLQPLDYLEDIKSAVPETVFIQTDHLQNPEEVVTAFLNEGINTGIAIGDRDLHRNYDKIYQMTNKVLVCTAEHSDPDQKYRQYLEDAAVELADKGMDVWIDGGVNRDIYQRLSGSRIKAAVMGRGVFADKERAVAEYCGGEQK